MIPEWLWIVWLALVGMSFIILETWAIFSKKVGDTLSERTRKWLGLEPEKPFRIAASSAFAMVLVLFVAWFVPHILFRFLF